MTNEPRSDDFVDSFLASAFASGGSSIGSVDPQVLAAEDMPDRIGRFAVVELVGAGGVGLVYRVEDPDLGRDVAVKVLRAAHAESRDAVERFREEARVCGRLTHPGVVTVHEVGELDDGRPFIAMKLVDGETLASILAEAQLVRGGHELVEVFEKVCQTVAYAHGRGVVHGDLKPQNVMVGAFGEVQVMDWGFAREGASSTARAGGTPAYMAPEQVSDAAGGVTPRTDVFGLGAILCEILTGAPPYLGETREEVYLRAKEAWQDDMNARLEACGSDPRLVELARRCLARSPEERPADAAEVAHEVAAHRGALEARSRALEIEAAEARAAVRHERRARRLTVALSGAIAAVIVVAAGSLFWFQRDAAARALDTQRAVDAALAVARAAMADARRGDADEESQWQAVRAAASRARGLAASRDADMRLAPRIDDEILALEAAADDGMLSLEVARRLDELRPHVGDEHAPAARDAAFAAAFAQLGVSLEAPVEDAAAVVRRSRIRPRLITALDQWARLRRDARIEAGGGWQRVDAIARAADDDAWRNELRAAYGRADREALLALAEAVQDEDRSPESLDLLASCLVDVGEHDAAVELWRRALERFPDDYELNHNLAAQLEYTEHPPRAEITRLFWAGLALRPRSAHAATDLALALIGEQRFADALVYLDRAAALGAVHPRTEFVRGIALESLGRLRAAAEAYGRAAGNGFRKAWLFYGATLDRLGRRDDAIAALRESVRHEPDQHMPVFQLGRVLCRARQTDEGIALLERSLAIDPDHAESWCNLAQAYAYTGRFDEAVEAARRGHAIGSARGSQWTYPSADWVEEMQQYAAIDERLEAIRAGELESSGPLEDSFLAAAALRRGLDRDALERFVSALAEPGWLRPDSRPIVYLEGALAAARVLAATEDAARRRTLLERAVAWLEAGRMELDPRESAGVAFLTRWPYEPEIDRLREAIEELPVDAALRRRWQALSAAIRELGAARDPDAPR